VGHLDAGYEAEHRRTLVERHDQVMARVGEEAAGVHQPWRLVEQERSGQDDLLVARSEPTDVHAPDCGAQGVRSRHRPRLAAVA